MADQHATQQTTAAESTERHGPPLPKWMFKIINPTMKAVLHSPLHGLMSKRLMVLSFNGRNSGKRYATPIGYIQRDNRLWLFTHSNWWKNLRGTPVSLRLRGRDVRGIARVLDDPTDIGEVAHMLVKERGEAMARRMGIVERDGAPVTKKAPEGTTFIEIKLEEPGG